MLLSPAPREKPQSDVEEARAPAMLALAAIGANNPPAKAAVASSGAVSGMVDALGRTTAASDDATRSAACQALYELAKKSPEARFSLNLLMLISRRLDVITAPRPAFHLPPRPAPLPRAKKKKNHRYEWRSSTAAQLIR